MRVTPLSDVEPRPRRVAVGEFDGVHLGHRAVIAGLIRQLLAANPFTTLQVVLEPTGRVDDRAVNDALNPAFLNALLAACLENPTYLDKFYALLPGRPNGAKRLVVLLPLERRAASDADRVADAGLDRVPRADRAGRASAPAGQRGDAEQEPA